MVVVVDASAKLFIPGNTGDALPHAKKVRVVFNGRIPGNNRQTYGGNETW
jgi:hypothetical protein